MPMASPTDLSAHTWPNNAAHLSALKANVRRLRMLAALLGTLTAFLMACMALTAKLAVRHGGTSMLNLTSRGIVGWTCSVVWLRCRSATRDEYIGPPHTRHLIIIRVLVGTAALVFFLLGLPLMPLGDVTAIFLTNQMWTCVLARVFFNEPFRLAHGFGLALAIPGALLLVQPPFIFGSSSSSTATPALAPLLPLISAIGAAGAYVSIQACTRAGAPRTAIVLCFTGGNALIGGCATLLSGDWHVLLTASSTCHLWLFLCGLMGFMAQLSLTAAIGLGSASTVAITMLSEVAFAFILEASAFGTQTSALTALGATLTTLGVLAAILLPASADDAVSSNRKGRGFRGLPETEVEGATHGATTSGAAPELAESDMHRAEGRAAATRA